MSTLEFPAGIDLPVLRPSGGVDRHGDPVGGDGWTVTHSIGPCSQSRSKPSRKAEVQASRAVSQLRITCTDLTADVRKGDRLRLPNGAVVEVFADPYAPRNPFTGWCPGLVITCEEVR